MYSGVLAASAAGICSGMAEVSNAASHTQPELSLEIAADVSVPRSIALVPANSQATIQLPVG